MKNKLITFLLVFSIFFIPQVLALTVNIPVPINYSTIPTVNSSDWWDGLNTPADISTGDLTDDNTYVEVSGDSMTGNLEIDDVGDDTSIILHSGDTNLNASLIFQEVALDRWQLLFNGLSNNFYLWNDFLDTPTWMANLATNEMTIYNDTTIHGNVLPGTTLTHSIGTGALRWLNLFVQNINAEQIDTFNLVATENVTAEYFIGNGSQLIGLPETNLTGYAKYQFNANNFNGSGNFTTTGNIETSVIDEDGVFFDLKGSGATASKSLGFKDDNGREWHIAYSSTGLNFAETGIANYRIFLRDGGNVGIGTNGPATKLDVNGVTTFRDAVYFTQTDGNEYIDSLTDGYVDVGATTGIRLNSHTVQAGEVQKTLKNIFTIRGRWSLVPVPGIRWGGIQAYDAGGSTSAGDIVGYSFPDQSGNLVFDDDYNNAGNFRINLATGTLITLGDIKQTADSIKHYLGASDDTSETFDGTTRISNAEVGSPEYNWTNYGGYNFDNDVQIDENLHISGNVSFENPHLTGYDNTTQSFLVLETAQAMNLSNNYMSHQIEIINNQNITFERKGHYQICVSPEFYQASGNDKWITFWLQENGVDVKWSNSRYTMDNDEYMAPRICWESIITTPATDNIRVMWLSDSTSSQIISIDGLTTPVRPGIPGVIMDVHWISNGD